MLYCLPLSATGKWVRFVLALVRATHQLSLNMFKLIAWVENTRAQCLECS